MTWKGFGLIAGLARRLARTSRTRCLWLIGSLLVHGLDAAEVIPAGAGSYLRGLPAGAKGPPGKIFVTEGMAGRPVPSNDWWSSMAWEPFSDVMHAHPLALKAEPAGMRISYPGANITANHEAIFGVMAGGRDDLVIGHSAVETFDDARVAGWSDWFVTARMGTDSRGLRLTFGHGSPFVYGEMVGGDPLIRFARPPEIIAGKDGGPTLGVRVGTRCYGLFAPAGTSWSGQGTDRLTVAAGDLRYFSVAVLPDARKETLERFARHAHVHVTDSRVDWAYDEVRGKVTTTFQVQTRTWEGAEGDPLLALYPHQWRATSARFASGEYLCVRGPMKLVEGRTFSTEHALPPALPSIPLTAGMDRKQIRAWLAEDLAPEPKFIGDTYWIGKELGKWATILPLAEQTGDVEVVAECDRRLRKVLELFLTAASGTGVPKREGEGLFAYEPAWGTLIGFPASYGSNDGLNDHHFHYGYFLRAAAEVGRRDRDWVRRWEPMLRMLVRDVASPDHRDRMYPFLRCFDPYAGHSWASGHAKFGDGNNNESSSEAVNAWFGLMMLGEVLEDRALRDLGAWLMAVEVSAIEDYWFDVRDELHPAAYGPSVVTMVWGGKGANATWFSANPEAVHGINFLPMTGGSLYLGRWPEYVRRNYAALVRENLEFDRVQAQRKSMPAPTHDGTQFDQWADLLWMYQALGDPGAARRAWDSRPARFEPEPGNSRIQTAAWIAAMEEWGTIDRTVSADAPFAVTFVRDGRRTHFAWNVSGTARKVRFSDGVIVECPIRGFGRK